MVVLTLLLLLRWLHRFIVTLRNSVRPPYSDVIDATLERKKHFLQRVGDQYGYQKSPAGHIDTWRQQELPGLIPPLRLLPAVPQKGFSSTFWRRSPIVKSTSTLNNADDNDDNESQVFLDFAGTALPTTSQLESIYMSNTRPILANPHSTGPAASKTMQLMEQAKKLILDHFHAHPGRFAGMSPPPPPPSPSALTTSSDDGNIERMSLDNHPGYEIVFTSGATESLRIVAEYFPWSRAGDAVACSDCGAVSKRSSTLLYSHNSHTSVLGMRGPVLAKGAKFCCKPLEEFDRLDLVGDKQHTSCCHCSQEPTDQVVHNLLVLPAECNFGGDRPNIKAAAANVDKANHGNNNADTRWWTLFDISKAASTGPIYLCDLNPDFACVSFYKMFGEPTGLGALFIKRTAIDFLVESRATPNHHRYFGGGSVDVILAGLDFALPRSAPSPLARLTQGTVHFRGIASLRHGFDQLKRLGGMNAIRQHTTCLTAELVRRFRQLNHANGAPAVRIYGAWSNQNLDADTALLPGTTVAFNLLRDDGSCVGYHEVSKLAALHQPPLQLRTGCFCNPGACQIALGLTDDDIQTNYKISGHVCGDDIDIIQNKPTGAVRASFGKDSIWEDMDSLLSFIEKTFVSRHKVHSNHLETIQPTLACLTEIYIFPIKSCAAQRVHRWQVDGGSGRLAFDREFALVDSSGIAMRLQTHPKMTFILPEVDMDNRIMKVSAPGRMDLILRLDDDDATDNGQQHQPSSNHLIQVCGNKCGGKLWGQFEASQWFSEFLGVQCWLARYSKGNYCVAPTSSRLPTPVIPTRHTQVAFANEQPLLLISEAAVSSLNQVLIHQGQEVARTLHFRPNLVIRHASPSSLCVGFKDQPFEDKLSSVSIVTKGIRLSVVGKCARCAMVDFDPISGRKGRTLRALADFRQHYGQITFGVFLEGASDFSTTGVVLIEEGDQLVCQ